MSVRERRNRKDRRPKTPEQLWHNRCRVCAEPIRRGQRARMIAGRPGLIHEECPEWLP